MLVVPSSRACPECQAQPPMNDSYPLEKTLWTSDDFEVMGWHDVRVWAMAASEEDYAFALDLDYLFKWVHPGPGETCFKFWVAPVTMVFENAHSIALDIASSQGTLDIADLHRDDPRPTPNGAFTEYLFRFECQEGTVSLRATSYRLYVRQAPRLVPRQWLSLAERGGLSVERRAFTTCDDDPVRAAALRLPPAERAALVAALLDSLEATETPDAGLEQAQAEEAQRRLAEVDAGAVTPVPWAEARLRLRAAANGRRDPP